MEEFEAQTARLEEEFARRGAQNAACLRPQVDSLMRKMRRKGIAVPLGLRRINTTLQLEAEDDFFDNMPV